LEGDLLRRFVEELVGKRGRSWGKEREERGKMFSMWAEKVGEESGGGKGGEEEVGLGFSRNREMRC